MTTPTRERLALDARRADLLARGRELFNRRAYDDIAIDDIAAAAGVSRGLLYHYFPSKRHFYVAIVRESADQLLAMTTADASLSPPEQLARGLDAYLAYVTDNASAYAALLRGGVGTDPEVAAIVDDVREVLMKRIARGVGVESPAGATRLALRGWIGFVEAAVLDWIDRRGTDRDGLLAMLVGVLGSALAAAASAAPSRGAPGDAKPAPRETPAHRTSPRRRVPRRNAS